MRSGSTSISRLFNITFDAFINFCEIFYQDFSAMKFVEILVSVAHVDFVLIKEKIYVYGSCEVLLSKAPRVPVA